MATGGRRRGRGGGRGGVCACPGSHRGGEAGLHIGTDGGRFEGYPAFNSGGTIEGVNEIGRLGSDKEGDCSQKEEDRGDSIAPLFLAGFET